MVTNVSSFGRSGLVDWVVQRVTAVILACYALYIFVLLVFHPELDYQTWQAMFASFRMRFFSLIALLSILAHGWIGMWAISTDYLTSRLMGPKATPIRIAFQIGCVLLTVFYLVWGIEILWNK
jgi:succinate dehydrogenase / fumarate reductase membrane anchor subunit